MKYCLFLLLIAFLPFFAKSQCSVTSTNGYTVNINIAPRTVHVTSSLYCLWSYNYNIGYDYVVTITGTPPPGGINTFHVLINCNGQIAGSYNVPVPGSGSLITTTNQSIGVDLWPIPWSYVYNPSCENATVSTLQCNAIGIAISAPGIPYQTINCLPGSGLPVELSDFTANQEGKNNMLKWTVESEHRNDHFTIKHSRDGYNWTDLAEVKSLGNTTEKREYSYEHVNPEIGLNFYSLSQTDTDGTFEELGIKGVENAPSGDQFAVFPNPANNNQTTIRVATSRDEQISYMLTDEMGRKVGFGELSDHVAVGNRNIFQQLIDLPEGYRFVYVSVYRNGELINTGKIVSL